MTLTTASPETTPDVALTNPTVPTAAWAVRELPTIVPTLELHVKVRPDIRTPYWLKPCAANA